MIRIEIDSFWWFVSAIALGTFLGSFFAEELEELVRLLI